MVPSIKAFWPALALVLLPAFARSAEDYGQWSHSGYVHLNTTPEGANVAGTVTRFPLLVRLDGSSFDFTQARKDGKDIRFASASGAHLPYQIERWDSARAVAEIWVLADTVHGNRDDQILSMHWGLPEAADSSRGGAVFDSSNGFLGVWHLSEGGGSRPNAVGTGLAAVPKNFGTTAAVPGAIGPGDSLDNDGTTQDYLQLYDDFSGTAKGFTYSVWINPSAATNYGRLLDLGNGTAKDNILLTRVGTTEDLSFAAYNGTTRLGGHIVAGAIKLNQWQQFAVTVSGREIRMYRNGDLIATDSLSGPLPAVARSNCYIGRSNWTSDSYYQGKVDEPVISKRVRGADWIRLGYANQKADQKLITFRPNTGCISGFQPPRDTSLAEGALLELAARADCATGFTWTTVSGMTPRILDPDVKTLQVFLPRVLQDEVLVYRFTARYGDSVRTKDVRVTVKEAIPDPAWTYETIPPWNGIDSLVIRAKVTNLAVMKSGRDSVITWTWTVSGLAVDTAWGADNLLLWNPDGAGLLKVGLCLHNGGAATCKETLVDVANPTSIRARPSASMLPGAPMDFRDATGRLRRASSGAPGLKAYPARQPARGSRRTSG